MEKKKAVAYWNVYDTGTGAMLEKEKVIERNPMPAAGGLIIGVAGKPSAIVRDFKFSGAKDGLPCYDVFV